ncbi:MAG: Urea ABC transporter, permease protein UrtB [Pseudolabrys sp.]|nr:Urea ABC transporter, permease protein UrtB [Pseudolabrys sp.]
MRILSAVSFAVLLSLTVLAGSLAASSAASAQGAGLEQGLQKFTTDDFSDTSEGIGAVAASGNPRAADILGALQDGRLMFDAASKTVFIKTAAGAVVNAATGRPAMLPDSADNVRLNNRLRGALDAVMGTLTLLSPDPAKRLDAAQAVFKSRDPKTLPALGTALAREKNSRIRRVLQEARAAAILSSDGADDAAKVAAIAMIRDRGDQDSLALLQSLPKDSPANVREAASAAVARIGRSLEMWSLLQNAWYGLSLGSVLLLAAIGLAITFGVMGVINMAHGEMVMLGAYVTFVVQQVIRAYDPSLFGYSLIVAIPLAFVVTGAAGVLIERSIIRFLYGRPLETLLATWGLSLILQQLVRTIFGPTNKDVGNPSWMSGAFDLGGMTITYNRLWIIVFAMIVFVALLAMLRFIRLGLEMRAVTQNRAMAAAMGIRTARIDALTFGLGSGIAGIAGVALSQIDNVSPNLGQGYIIDSFLVVVFGGVGNLWGTLVGALTLGVANKFLEPFAGAVLGKIAILVFIILFIQKRPRGMFALKGRAVEA